MKKIMLTVAGMLFVSLMVNAQVTQDTARTTTGETGVYSDDQSNYSRDMEVIQSTDVPSSLRTTLGDAEYSGWEEGKVYRNTSTNEYLIVIGDEDAKVYRFDENGSRIEDLDAESNNSGSDMNNDMNQSGDLNQSGDMNSDTDTQTDGTSTTDQPGTTDDTGSTTQQPDGSSSTR
jgi:hypothetical protein